MGQQQLLLVILVTIIVGIATVVAINTFGSAADNANVDAVRNDLLSVASAAQGYYMKPTMMGGGGQKFDGITWNDMGSVAIRDSTTTIGVNENGIYTIESKSGDELKVQATPKQAEGTITITIGPDDATMGDYTAPTD